MSTNRARSHSPRLFAWASWRVDAATPSSSSPWSTKFSERIAGSRWRSIVSAAAFGQQLAEALDA